MAKITTVIDIGSNSMRMVVFKKTSRYAFHLINESKSKVKISQGSYENNGVLQEIPMQRAFDALKSFLNIAVSLKSRKILCVATSALRDAPNKKEFLTKVKKELKLNIKIIDGQKEAYYGAVASSNLLGLNSFATLDIGGGSTEIAIIKDKIIKQKVSLKIGTVRVEELFLSKGDIKGAKQYIIDILEKNKTIFQDYLSLFSTIAGLGGTSRAIARSIIAKENYPLDILHNFRFDIQNNQELFKNIIEASSKKELKNLAIRKDRFDTIKAGTMIFQTIIEYFGTKSVVTSGVGVREGVYLCDILRTSNHKFPSNFNISVRSLLDRFTDDKTQSAYLGNNVKKIFDILQPCHNLDIKYKSILVIISKLQLVGLSLDFYKSADNNFWFILNGLNYIFTHEEKLLISIVSKFTTKALPKENDIKEYKDILPDIQIIRWLNFMMSLNIVLNTEFLKIKYDYIFKNNTLEIKSNIDNYLIKDTISKLEVPSNINIQLVRI